MGRAKIIPGPALLLPFQSAWVNDRSRIKLGEKSRQIGWSWAASYDESRKKGMQGVRYDSWISSRDEIQAQLFVKDAAAFAGLLNLAAEDIGLQVIDPEKKQSAYVLQFATGVRINSMSSNPDAQAGKRGDRVLDEFALHRDPRLLYSIAYPGITWGGQLSIFSTHRGSGNYFNELIREIREKGNPKKISLHRVTLQDALNQGFLFKLQGKLPPDDERQEMDEADYFNFIRSGCADEESFLQEYMCVPADDAGAFLPYDLIASCEYREGELYETPLADARELYVGVDIGRTHDLTVIWCNELAGGRHLTRRKIELKDMPFSQQEEILYELLARPNMRRCCIDATGLGMQFAERAIDRYGKYRVEAVRFSPAVKEELAYPLRAAFEDGNVRIPFDKFLRADLRAIRKETTAAGNIRFSADRGENGHSDRFWALALAIHAASDANGGPVAAWAAEADKRNRDEMPMRPEHDDDDKGGGDRFGGY